MKNRPSLIIIPGLGDHVRRYKLVVPIWRLRGYRVHVFSFGWNDEAEDFDGALQRLLRFVDALPAGRIDIIGASAGGTAAINALAHRASRIGTIITIATPYRVIEHLHSNKLSASVARMSAEMTSMSLSKILSIRGVYDGVVPPRYSVAPNVRTKIILMIGHGLIIATTLIVGNISKK